MIGRFELIRMPPMLRRRFATLVASAPLLTLPFAARAQSLLAISDADATRGVRAALDTGASTAVRLLGAQDGFLGNPRVRIPLPDALQKAARLLKVMGQQQQVDDLEVAINRAAESAVPLAKTLLANAVRSVTVADAKNILTGGETSVTDFFAERTRAPLSAQFLPVVGQVTAKIDLAARYDRLAGQAARMGLLAQQDASIDAYVTRKALDALYLVIGDEERKLRRDPLGASSDILRKVFGAMR